MKTTQRFMVLVALCAWLYSFAQAQTVNGYIVGTVADPSEAVIAGAAVTATNLDTAEKRAATTDASGNYRLSNLAPGRYRVDIEMQGFKRFTREPVVVQVDAAVRIDARLDVGATTEVVTVTEQTPLLQTESATLSHLVEAKAVQEMPLNGRNVLNLIALAPGVVPGGSTAGATSSNQGAGHTNTSSWNNYQIGGGLQGQNAMTLDGAPTIGLGSNMVGLVPTQEAVQEFRVATNSASAEFGRSGGGVVNLATKAGGNAFHGSAYEFFRNRVLNANNFFNNAARLPRAPFNQNQYGVSLNGPVRRDRLFFMFSWEQLNQRIGQTTTTFVPTDAQRAGDFSATLGAPIIRNGAQVINPCTNQPVRAGQIFDPLTTRNVGGVNCRLPFEGNKIPANRLDATANIMANTLKYWPSPNISLPGGNFISTVTPGSDQYQYNGRLDYALSERQRLFGRFTYWNVADISLNPFSNSTGNPPSNVATHQLVVGDNYTFSPTTLLEVRGSYMRFYYDDRPVSTGIDLAKFGPAYATLNNQVTYRTNVSPGVTGLYLFQFMTVATRHYRDNYTLAANLTRMLGSHTLKLGGEARLQDYNSGATVTPSGRFTFNGNFSSFDGTAATATGAPFASFMLGYAATGTLTAVHPTSMFAWYQGYYATDAWQVNRKLTVNYGARWELPGAYAERNDAATILAPNAVDPLSQASGLSLKGALAFVDSALWPQRTTQEVKHNLFAPRLGVAWRLTDKTVVRLGYGISYLPMDLPAAVQPSASPINAATTVMATSVNNAGLIPLNTLSNPFPAGGVAGTTQQQILQPSGRSQAYLDSLKGLTVASPIPDQPFGYTQQWNLNIQREWLAGFLTEIGYAGSKGTHIPTPAISLNQLDSRYFAQGSALLTTTRNPMAGLLNRTSPLNGANITQGQLLRPYPQYVNFSNNAPHVGSTSYHSLQTRVEKRFTSAGLISANYTWSKLLGNTDTALGFLEGSAVGGYQDFNNLRGERSLLSFDTPHRLVVSYVLDLPFGKGRKFFNGASGALDRVVSGWAINGITTLQKGFPLALTAQPTVLSQSFGAGTPRPNVVSGCDKIITGAAQQRLGQWFNTACFTQPSAYSFGSESRVDPDIRIAGINNFDFTVTKTTAITEQVRLQFRAEFFNLFNRVQFGAPGAVLGAQGFGSVSSQANQPRLAQLALRLAF
jgi:hypothetical protein